ncbi:cupin domain-containing protein [Caulobacter sp. KR2-114]|uniref:cupin domain-containing protein n=1 Tax=Caulobacter sp. KR2-114 TaxID=3400912 RepID=UPI003BFADED5
MARAARGFEVRDMTKLTVAEGKAALVRRNGEAGTPARRAITLFERPDFDVRLYAPVGADYPQTPHLRDELYVIASGSGSFTSAGQKTSCNEGDLFFVPAGGEHGFSDLSDDFSTWVIFIGPPPGRVKIAG